MPEGGDAEVLEIVKERKIDVVLGKGLRVLAYSDMSSEASHSATVAIGVPLALAPHERDTMMV